MKRNGSTTVVYADLAAIRHPEPIRAAWANFTALGLAVLFKGYSFGVAWRSGRVDQV